MQIVNENPNIINQAALYYWKDAIEYQDKKLKIINIGEVPNENNF
jgi:hypothetical protein